MTKPTFDYAKAKEVTHKLGQLNPLRRACATRGTRQCRAFPCERSSELCQWTGDRGRRRPDQFASGDTSVARPDLALKYSALAHFTNPVRVERSRDAHRSGTPSGCLDFARHERKQGYGLRPNTRGIS